MKKLEVPSHSPFKSLVELMGFVNAGGACRESIPINDERIGGEKRISGKAARNDCQDEFCLSIGH